MNERILRLLDECRKKQIEVVVIGTSAGGVEALRKILPAFRKPSPLSVVVVIHLPSKGSNMIPALYAHDCFFNIKEADSGEAIETETIYLAPPDYHLGLESDKTLSLSVEEPVNFSRPAIDILFKSAADACQERVLGILLTGANSDGALGLKYIKENEGICIIQDPKDAYFATMPEAGLRVVTPDEVFDIDMLKEFLKRLSQQERMHD